MNWCVFKCLHRQQFQDIIKHEEGRVGDHHGDQLFGITLCLAGILISVREEKLLQYANGQSGGKYKIRLSDDPLPKQA